MQPLRTMHERARPRFRSALGRRGRRTALVATLAIALAVPVCPVFALAAPEARAYRTTAAGSSPGSLAAGMARLGGFASAVPLEDRLSAGTTGFLRTVSRRFRQLRRVLGTALARWQTWLGGALAFAVFAAVVPVLDAAVIDVWRREGLRAFLRALLAGMAVYLRLLRDSRTPAVGKALLVFALVYGVAGRDLMVDGVGFAAGLADDFLLLVLVSRAFMRMCPDTLVEEHAARVAARAG